jgi:hypothetical protein
VTLNAGLAWEPYFGQNILNNAISNFSLDNFRKNVKSTVFLKAPAGLIYPGDAGYPEGQSGLNKQWMKLLAARRPGVGRERRTAARPLRSSYGLAYDFPTAEYHNINAQAPPFGNRSLVVDPTGRFDDPTGRLAATRIRSSPTRTPTTFRSARSARSIPTSTRRACSRGTSPSNSSSDRTGARRSAIWAATRIACGIRWRSTRRVSGPRPCVLQGVSFPVCTTNANLDRRRVLTLAGENPAAATLIGNLDLHTTRAARITKGLKLSSGGGRRAASA